MAERRPLVLVNGQLTELPTGDTLPGVGGASSWSVVTTGQTLVANAPGVLAVLTPSDPNWSSVTAASLFNGNFIDEFGLSFSAVGGAAIDATRQLFSRNTLTLNGSSGYIEAAGASIPAAWQIGGLTTFCIDFWVFTTSTAIQCVVGNLNDPTGAAHVLVALSTTAGGAAQVFVQNSAGSWRFGSGTFPTGSWRYVRIAVDGGNIRCFIGTTAGGSETQLGTTQAYSTGATSNLGFPLRMGRSSGAGNAFFLAGSLLNVRMTKGNSRGNTAGTVPSDIAGNIVNYPLPASISAGQTFLLVVGRGSTSGTRARIVVGAGRQVVGTDAVADDLLVDPGQTAFLVARSSTLLEVA